MRRIILYLSIIIPISTGMVNGQTINIDSTDVMLESLFGRLDNNYVDKDRLRINDSIRLIIDNYAESDTVFNHKFADLRYLGQVTSPDSLIKIITWNLVLDSAKSRYFCYFIRKQEPVTRNKIYRLTATYKEDPIRTDNMYSEHDWYGALYYDIKPFISDNKRYWILLGIDFGNPFVNRKIIDVLSFTTDNSIMFGRKWFASGDKIKFRDVFEYASNAIMSLRFKSDSSIVFDHLVPFSPEMIDNHQYYGPDYSYDAYYLENGLWRLTINVDVRNKE